MLERVAISSARIFLTQGSTVSRKVDNTEDLDFLNSSTERHVTGRSSLYDPP